MPDIYGNPQLGDAGPMYASTPNLLSTSTTGGATLNLSAGLASGDVVAVTPLDWLREHQIEALLAGGAVAFFLGHRTLAMILAGIGAGLWLLRPAAQQTVIQGQITLPLTRFFQ